MSESRKEPSKTNIMAEIAKHPHFHLTAAASKALHPAMSSFRNQTESFHSSQKSQTFFHNPIVGFYTNNFKKPEIKPSFTDQFIDVYAAFLKQPWVNTYQKTVIGAILGATIGGVSFFGERLVNMYALKNKEWLESLKIILQNPLKGFGPTVLKGTLQMSIIYTVHSPIHDFLKNCFPEKEVNPKIAASFSAFISRASTYHISVLGFWRALNNLSYREIVNKPLGELYSGFGTILARDTISFPLFLMLKEQLEERIYIKDSPPLKNLIVGFLIAACMYPLTGPLTLASDLQKITPGMSAIDAFKEIYHRGGVKGFYRGAGGRFWTLAFFTTAFTIGQNITDQAKARNEQTASLPATYKNTPPSQR